MKSIIALGAFLLGCTLAAPATDTSGPISLDITVDGVPFSRSLNGSYFLPPANVTLARSYFLPPSNVTLARSLEVSNRATNDCGCGRAPAASRIVGGKVSKKHSRPYQIYMQACSDSGCWSCGGTLLNKQYVLTAAHCVDQAKAGTIKVALGEHDIQKDVETKTAQQIMGSAIVHPQWNRAQTEHDIAIIKLNSAVTFNDNVVPACLPTDKTKTYAGQSAVVSGWGAEGFQGAGSKVLKETTIKILADTDLECRRMGPSSWKMCAYKKGTNACSGDSGGPLVVKEDGRYTVVGAVSHGAQCADTLDGYAAIYARVTFYLDWINENIKGGKCTGGTSTATTKAPATTTTTKAPATGKACDLSCFFGDLTNPNVLINGEIAVSCTNGKCTAKDGSDLCATFGNPCSTFG